MYNILICDDEKDIVSALKIYLSSEKDYNLFEAYTGKEAIEIVKNNKNCVAESSTTQQNVKHFKSLLIISFFWQRL